MDWVAFGLIVAAPLVAHLAGWLTLRRMRAVRAHVADSIPGLARRERGDGTDGDAARRFDRAVDRTFDRLAARFASGVQGARARSLAAELNLPQEVVATALDQLTDAAAHGLRITDAGTLLIDFEPGATEKITRRTLLGWPARVGWFLTACVANLGSIWPSVFIATVCGLALSEVQDLDQLIEALLPAVFAILAGLLAYWVSTRVSRLASRPWTATPDPGPPHGQEDTALAAKEEEALHEEIGVFSPRSGVQGVWSVYKSVLEGFFRSSGDKRGVPIAVIVSTLVALVALAVVGVFSWHGGLWKILSGRLPRLVDQSPGSWVREPQAVGSAFLELGDELALTLTSAVRRLCAHARPRDEELAARVVALARGQGGRVSGLDLILSEGFDEAEAVTVAARVTGQAQGQVLVSEAGDVDCLFAPDPESPTDVQPAPLEAIALDRDQATAISDAIPVNVPGVTRYRLDAALNMATGALLAAVGWATLSPAGLLGGAALVGLSLVTLATWGLVGAARYGVRESARVGLLRDARRGALQILAGELRGETSSYLARSRFDSLVETLDGLDPANGADTVWREVDLALSDAGVELSLSQDGPEELSYELGPLRERLASLDALREEEVEPHEIVEIGDEVVVFEARAQEHVTA
jgi:hypothetical protein